VHCASLQLEPVSRRLMGHEKVRIQGEACLHRFAIKDSCNKKENFCGQVTLKQIDSFKIIL
jgi:hypothetical protein